MTTPRKAAARKPRQTSLAVVKPGEQPESPKQLSVAEAAESGSQRDLLVAMKRRLANAVSDPKCPPRDLASLSRRLEIIAEQIAALDLRAREEGREGELTPDAEWDEAAL